MGTLSRIKQGKVSHLLLTVKVVFLVGLQWDLRALYYILTHLLGKDARIQWISAFFDIF